MLTSAKYYCITEHINVTCEAPLNASSLITISKSKSGIKT